MAVKNYKATTRWSLKHGLIFSFLLIICLVFQPHSLRAAISDVPLFLTADVPPNIMLLIDDSGSMDSEVLLPTNDGALWWNTDNQSFVGNDGILNYNQVGAANSTWKKYVYLFPNGTSTGNRFYGDSDNDHYAIPPIGPLAFLRSADYNGMYYDTQQDYTPWVSAGGYTFSDVPTDAAPSDPVRGTGTVKLDDEIQINAGNHVFRFHNGMVIPQGTMYLDWSDNAWKKATADRLVTDNRNVPIQYYPATFYQQVVSEDTYKIDGTNGVCNNPQPAHYSTYVDAPGSFLSDSVDALAPDGSCLKRYEIKTGNTFPSGRTYEAELQNFANWFSYTRKRHLALRNGAGKAFDEASRARVGGFRINERNLQGMWDIDTEKDTFYDFLYNAVASGGTPNRLALNYAGQQYNTNTSVITERCQQNFVMLFTDGFSNPDDTGVGNVDSGEGVPYEDNYSNTIADIAMDFYQGPLRSDLTSGGVPVSRLCGTDEAPPWLNCNADLHMVTYGITLGARGNIFGVTHDTIEDAYDDPPSWTNPTDARNPHQVDDLYHACVNSRGDLLNANNSTELTAALSSALNAILSQSVGSAAAIATNSTRLIDNTLIYQARFDSSDWSGTLLAYELVSDGSLESVKWSTDDGGIPVYPARAIYSWNGTDGIPFAWGSLSGAQQAQLSSDQVEWLRGDRSNEGTGLRVRTKILGDIINSDPLVVGVPNFRYELSPTGTGGDTYAAFRQTVAARPRMLYVGGNDGMLHAFDATTGEEKFAYVPGGVYANLADLTLPEYEHKYYVDGPPAVGDAYIGGSWKTIVVGGLGAGGRSIYALDVTNPLAFDDTKVLWEFGYDADTECVTGVTACRDIGYTFGKPVLARMQNGDWAVIFGNGYESGSLGNDPYKAKLFIVNAANGQLIRVIDAGTAGDIDSRNGLSAPTLLADANQTIDYAYAGDLHGNLWKFDLSDADASNWGLALSGNPLFVTQSNQPITAPVNIGLNENGGYMIYFGTGKYFEVGDNDVSTPDKQSFYGVWDVNGIPRDLSDLVQQTIIHQGQLHDESSDSLRVVSNNPVIYAKNANKDPYGWYLDLVPPSGALQGERVVSAPLLRRGRVIFTTLIPDTDPCSPGGTSWLMELDAMTGGRLSSSVLDINDDGEIDDDDFVEIDDPENPGGKIAVSVSGRKSEVGIVKTPAVIEAGTLEFKYFGGSDGQGGEVVDGVGTGIEIVTESGGDGDDFGRRSWRQLQ